MIARMAEWTPADWFAVMFGVVVVAWLIWLFVFPIVTWLVVKPLLWWWRFLRRRTGTDPEGLPE